MASSMAAAVVCPGSQACAPGVKGSTDRSKLVALKRVHTSRRVRVIGWTHVPLFATAHAGKSKIPDPPPTGPPSPVLELESRPASTCAPPLPPEPTGGEAEAS